MSKNIQTNFWSSEGKSYTSRGELFYEVKQGDTLSYIAQDIKEARQLKESESTIMEYIIKENNIKKVDNDYPIQIRQKINIGVLSKTSKPYALYLDVTNEVKSKISSWKSQARGIPLTRFFDNLKPNGSWDIKRNINYFNYSNRSQYFYMANWKYKGNSLVTYEDVQNMIYGALAIHIYTIDYSNMVFNTFYEYFFDTPPVSINEIDSVLMLKELKVNKCNSTKEINNIMKEYLYGDEFINEMSLGSYYKIQKLFAEIASFLSKGDDSVKTKFLHWYLNYKDKTKPKGCLRIINDRTRIKEAIKFGHDKM